METTQILGMIEGLCSCCAQATVQESTSGMQAHSRWSAVIRLRELLEALGINVTDRELHAAVNWTPPEIDYTRPVPGSRVVWKPRGRVLIAVRKRLNNYKGTPITGKRYELVKGSDAAYRMSSMPDVQWITLLGEFDTEEAARAAFTNGEAQEPAS